MPDISKAKIKGIEYDIKDEKARESGKSPYIGENGNWYVWDDDAGAYADTGVSAGGGGSGVALDETLTQSGQAAEAKAVGDALDALSQQIGDLAELETEDKSSLVAAINEVLASGGGTVIYHSVTANLTNCTLSNSDAQVSNGSAYSAVLTPADGYSLKDVTVAMGGVDITSAAWDASTNTISIASVTGDVVISATAAKSADTSPVIAYENYGLNASGVVTAFAGVGITKIYPFTPNVEAMKASSYYDAENDYATTNGAFWRIALYTPTIKMVEAGYSTTSLTTNASKVAIYRDDTVASAGSNTSLTGSSAENGTSEYKYSIPRYSTDAIYANGFAVSLSLLDADDSYAYWRAGTDDTCLPIGVRAGDVIFAGKNTPYYGMANIDGTMLGEESAAESSVDDDYSMDNLSVMASSLEGTDVADPTIYGVTDAFAAVIDEARKAWMIEYGGNINKIPVIVHTDQHGRLSRAGSLFKYLNATLNWYSVSKIMNLGDTVSVEWYDADTEHPLLSDSVLEDALEAQKTIPYSKRLDVFGNHDTWYGNYADEGNTIGTRYPSSQAHLEQYFKNIYARRTNNNGWFVVYDDYFNVKYVVVSAFEYQNSVSFRISTAQMSWLITELSKNDGYDVVIVSHVPLYWDDATNIQPEDVYDGTAETLRVSNVDTDALFAARKNKTSGTVQDSDGVTHSFDFSGCTSNCLCSLHGHTHRAGANYTGGALMGMAFDWFADTTFYFVLIDRKNEQLNVWKVSNPSAGPETLNYQIPFDPVTE